MRNSLLVGFGLVALFAGPVAAADLSVPVKAPAAKPVQLYNWTGCYAGAQFGSAFIQQDWGPLGAGSDTGLVLGGQAGCNYQISSWVFGMQGDGAWSDASGTHTNQMSALGLLDEWKANSLGSVTGRAGYAWDRLLTYGKGGAAWTHNKYTTPIADTTTATASETRSGWTVGGGFEYAITNNLSMFFEYDFYDFGTKTVGFTSAAGSETVDIRDRESIVKVGANWKFGW